MSTFMAYEVHSAAELRSRKKARKTSDAILKMIRKQREQKAGGTKKGRETKEEYLTRAILEHRGFLLHESEPILFDQYPLFKYPEHSDKADIVYAYKERNEWRLGLVEAKITGGEDFTKAVSQSDRYLTQFALLANKRIEALGGVAKSTADIVLSEHTMFGRIDILAPSGWWDRNLAFAAKHKPSRGSFRIPLRFLRVTDNYIPKDGGPTNIEVSVLKP